MVFFLLFLLFFNVAQGGAAPSVNDIVKEYKKDNPLKYVRLAGNIEKLLLFKSDLNIRILPDNSTLLIELSKDPSTFIPPLIEKIIQAGANPLLVDNKGMVALAYATQSGSVETIQILLDANAYPTLSTQEKINLTTLAQDQNKKNLFAQEKILENLFKALHENNIQEIKKIAGDPLSNNIINKTRSLLINKRRSNATPLLYAVGQDNLKLLEILGEKFKNSLNINQLDQDALTPLMVALNNKKYQAAQALLSFKPNLTVRDSENHSALYYLFKYYPTTKKVILLLLPLLIEQGIDVNEVVRDTMTALFIILSQKIIDEDDLSLMRLLLKAGANPNSIDQQGNTPLIMLIKNFQYNNLITDLITLFLSHGANINSHNKNNETALSLVSKNNDIVLNVIKEYNAPPQETLQSLYKLIETLYTQYKVSERYQKYYKDILKESSGEEKRKKLATQIEKTRKKFEEASAAQAKNLIAILPPATLNIAMNIDNQHLTPLMAAALRNKVALLKQLLSRSDVNIQNNKGQTALIIAAEHQNKEALEALLAASTINLNMQDEDGYTVLMLAALSPTLFDIIPLLIKKGARLDVRNKNGKTARELAISTRIDWGDPVKKDDNPVPENSLSALGSQLYDFNNSLYKFLHSLRVFNQER